MLLGYSKCKEWFRSINLLKDVQLKSFHSKSFIQHEFLPLGGTQAWNTTCLSKTENWKLGNLKNICFISTFKLHRQTQQSTGRNDRNLITREKDTYRSTRISYTIRNIHIDKRSIYSLFSLHIDVRRDVRYLTMIYKILLYHYAVALWRCYIML